jgi:hypothetical protein
MTQAEELTWFDRVRLAWRDLRYGREHNVFSVVPPGHYHSPVPALDDVGARAAAVFAARTDLPGVDLRVDEQLALAAVLAPYVSEHPFAAAAPHGLLYRLDNPFFSGSDGLIYHALLRHWQPRRVIEVGSGYSTALLLDTIDLFFDERPEITSVDPNPQRLRSLLRPGDHLEVLTAPAEQVPVERFAQLSAGDVLFIDSSHVSKVGSDVNHLFLDVLPTLAAGVHVHVHDMHYPEYPQQFVFGGMHWNEAYLVRALLTGNAHLRVVWWNGYLAANHRDEVAAVLPGWGGAGRSSLWFDTA